MKADKPFATEAALCARFLDLIKGRPWTAYPESCGFDILLIRNEDGFQIGVEAKLTLNLDVIMQAMESRWSAFDAGPDCRAVLVPCRSNTKFAPICAYIGLTIIKVRAEGQEYGMALSPGLPRIDDADFEDWFELFPRKRLTPPAYVPDVPCGVPSPVRLTQWKIKAIKIAVTLEKRGHVTRHDFKHIGTDPRRWINADSGYLEIQDGRLTKGPTFPDFRAQHPKNYEQIAADFEKWAAPELPELLKVKR